VHDLPEGWRFLSPEEREFIQREYELELPAVNPQVHPLAGIPVRVIADCEGNDDVLVRHLFDPTLFSVVHLTWRSAQEVANHPTLEFAGSFAEFLAWNVWDS
jgi:hypothetical protein